MFIDVGIFLSAVHINSLWRNKNDRTEDNEETGRHMYILIQSLADTICTFLLLLTTVIR